MLNVEMLRREDGETIAYLRRLGKRPGVVWLGGFKSEMTGNKAAALDEWAKDTGHAFVRFDYFGHGQSSGEFRDGTVSRWLDDSLVVLDGLTDGPQIVVGSSMGGWLALLLARQRPERIRGLLLIAPAADFSERMWNALPPQTQQTILEKGEWLRPSAYDPDPYPITRGLIEDGRKHLLGSPIRLGCPVRILHGGADPDVPWTVGLDLMQSIEGDVTFTLVKDGDHRLSTPANLKLLTRTLNGLIADAG